MELSFIGTGSAFSGKINNSAYLKSKNSMLLIDCGETVFGEILRRNLLDGVDSVYVFITHTHSDHVGSLSSLIHYINLSSGAKVHLVGDKGYKIKSSIDTLLKINGNTKEQYDYATLKKVKDVFGFADAEIAEVSHSPLLHSYAIKFGKFSRGGVLQNIYFTGDCCDVEYIKSALNDEFLHKIYCDVSLQGGGVHLPLEDAVKLFAGKSDKVVFMHIENGFVENRLKNQGFKCAVAGVDHTFEREM